LLPVIYDGYASTRTPRHVRGIRRIQFAPKIQGNHPPPVYQGTQHLEDAPAHPPGEEQGARAGDFVRVQEHAALLALPHVGFPALQPAGRARKAARCGRLVEAGAAPRGR
jgi:hypothetical protein